MDSDEVGRTERARTERGRADGLALVHVGELVLGEEADLLAHGELELGQAQLPLAVAQRPPPREGHKVRRRHVDPRLEVLPGPRGGVAASAPCLALRIPASL